ncbi:uncharacterized protein Dyak_GE28858 [Drosophila yakuba]|uniref:Uncharacterized protein n=1 Tax=Drosophila yakuba TaxID=7245 RepID=A0A0R1E8W3_DROYA|nr:uncharacterized protein Dyak_GE28858 [Drosophila yakuba]
MLNERKEPMEYRGSWFYDMWQRKVVQVQNASASRPKSIVRGLVTLKRPSNGSHC